MGENLDIMSHEIKPFYIIYTVRSNDVNLRQHYAGISAMEGSGLEYRIDVGPQNSLFVVPGD